ncbi:MAG: SH3 domain-containing protein [Rhodanobacteraceae bacterium]
MTRALSVAALGLSVFLIPSAFGADGYVTGNVDLRAGPDTSYPSVVMLPVGAEVAIEGCVDGWSWCDVAAGNIRGWVPGDFLQEEYQGQRVLIPEYGVRIGIPIVSFVFGTYWESHYRNRSWYGNREHWSHVRPEYRPAASDRDRHGNMHENANTHSHGISAGTSHPSHDTPHRAGSGSRQAAIATTPRTVPVRKASPHGIVAEHNTAHAKAPHKSAPKKNTPKKKDNDHNDGH